MGDPTETSQELTERDPSEKAIEEQGRDRTGQKRIRVCFDERNLQTSYVGGFHPTMTAEEVVLDFGLNIVRSTGKKEDSFGLLFQGNNRLIMSYHSSGRLAIALGLQLLVIAFIVNAVLHYFLARGKQ